MKKRFKYLLVAVICFITCVLIVILFKDYAFIRGFLGDVVVIILFFSFIKIFFDIDALKLCIGLLLFSFGIEILQLMNFIRIIGLENFKLARVVFGATFDFWDLFAYAIGAVLTFFLDKKVIACA